MDKKTYQQISKKLEKTCKVIHDLMKNHRPEAIFEVLITGAPPDDVALLALFSGHMQTQFVQKTVELAYQFDAECESDAEICAACGDRETCQDRKDKIWMQ